MSAPSFWSPLRCWSIGRTPMAQPPGSATRAVPWRATRGPRTRTEARMVETSSYGARALVTRATCTRSPPAMRRSEERRVGEEGRARWAADHLKKKKDGKRGVCFHPYTQRRASILRQNAAVRLARDLAAVAHDRTAPYART